MNIGKHIIFLFIDSAFAYNIWEIYIREMNIRPINMNIQLICFQGTLKGYGLFSLRLIGSVIIGATFNLVAHVGLP